jgi:hypothetical protein
MTAAKEAKENLIDRIKMELGISSNEPDERIIETIIQWRGRLTFAILRCGTFHECDRHLRSK